jgi:predicted RNase H-like HicB family nuclease
MSGSEVIYVVRIHNEGPGELLWADVEELPGCFASGRDMEELREALTEAIGLYLSTPEHPVHAKVSDEPGSVTEQRVLVTC